MHTAPLLRPLPSRFPRETQDALRRERAHVAPVRAERPRWRPLAAAWATLRRRARLSA